MNKPNDPIPGWLIVLGLGALAVWLLPERKSNPAPKVDPDLEGQFDRKMGADYLDEVGMRQAAKSVHR